MQKLVKRGYAAKSQLLALQRHKEELEGNRGQYMAGIAKVQEAMIETDLQLIDFNNEFATQIADEMREVQATISDQEEKLGAASDVLGRTTITAPYEGIVTGLKYHTIGGVITPGTPIMDIVPQADRLVVEAQVQPHDIDVVEAGLETRISFSAYKTRSLPRLSGKVVQVSADAFTHQQGPAMPSYYTARVEVDAQELSRLHNKVRLYPGMPVDVFIRTGSRSFLGYVFAPITGSLERAFNED
jgi:HlyD family type I secretion membrane fusion protein